MSILVDTFFTRIFMPKQHLEIHNISVVHSGGTEREVGGNKGMSGGFCFRTGTTGIYSEICRLYSGNVSYGGGERELRTEVGREGG